ncbi:MAG: hypothetical protein J6D23_05875 [Clostridia bacterium]|nr:hypothetical protein [Clostridia bacterium]
MKKTLLMVLMSIIFTLVFAVSISAAEKACTSCGEVYGAPVIETQPNCGNGTNGVLKFTCTCGKTETLEFEPIHLYQGVITTEPSCNTDGLMTYTCTACKDTTTEVIPAKHKHHSVVDVAATHTTTGSMTHTCEYCGDTYKTTLPIVHNFKEVSRTVSDCKATITYKCQITDCTVTKTETVISHNYSFSMIEKEPTCFFEGVIGGYCVSCGKIVETALAKQHKNETEVTKAATCTETGILRQTCLYCDTTHTDIIPASHDYSAGVTHIVYKDGYTEYGTRYIRCAKCSAEEGLLANPIFTFKGYSRTDFASGQKVEISCGYTVNVDALNEYQSVMEIPLSFGIVGAAEDHCELLGANTAPLVSQTGEPVANADVTFTLNYEDKSTAEQKINCKVKKVEINKTEYATLNGKFTGIPYEHHTTYFYFCLYIFDGTKTVYVSDDSCRDLPLPISYALLNNAGGDHDTVNKNSVSIGGLEYSTVDGTEANADRTTTIQNSIKDAKTNQEYADSASNEKTVAGIGNLGNMVGTLDRATELLNYYLELGGDATHYKDFDIEKMLSDSETANSSWLTSINNILRASEALAIVGERVNIDQKAETIVDLPQGTIFFNNKARDLYLSFVDGRYYTDTDIDNLTVTTVNGKKVYTATIVYTLIDYYSFYPYKDDDSTSSFLLWGPSKQELAQLHLDGSALDFLIHSQLTYEVTWTEGQRAGEDSNFNKLEGFTKETTGATLTLVSNSATQNQAN